MKMRTFALAALAIGAAWLFDNPWFALLGGMAFLVDATVPPPLERHRLFAVVCAGAGFWLFTGEAAAGFAYASPLERWLPLIVAGGFLVVILLTTRVEATGDATGEPLSLARVRAGMWVGLFVAAQSLLKYQDPVGRMRGREYRFEDIPLLVTYHPAYLLRSPEQKAKAWQDLLRLRAVLDRGV